MKWPCIFATLQPVDLENSLKPSDRQVSPLGSFSSPPKQTSHTRITTLLNIPNHIHQKQLLPLEYHKNHLTEMSSCFLELPPDVRAVIYRFAGLTRECPIDLATEGHRHKHLKRAQKSLATPWQMQCHYKMFKGHQTPSMFVECFCSPLPYQLLLVCRVVYNEALSILYSENAFKLVSKYDAYTPQFGPLMTLNAKAWASLQSLHAQAEHILLIPFHIPVEHVKLKHQASCQSIDQVPERMVR